MNYFYFSQKQADVYSLFNLNGQSYKINSVIVGNKVLIYTEWCVDHESNSGWDDKTLVGKVSGKPKILHGPELW